MLDIFSGGARHHHLLRDGQLVQTFQLDLAELQRQVLDLLAIPETTYMSIT